METVEAAVRFLSSPLSPRLRRARGVPALPPLPGRAVPEAAPPPPLSGPGAPNWEALGAAGGGGCSGKRGEAAGAGGSLPGEGFSERTESTRRSPVQTGLLFLVGVAPELLRAQHHPLHHDIR